MRKVILYRKKKRKKKKEKKEKKKNEFSGHYIVLAAHLQCQPGSAHTSFGPIFLLNCILIISISFMLLKF
jgi:hypothetical protein